MSTTPTTFTITQSGTYRTTDGRAAYWFEAGTIIPMYLAIALGIEGAGYVDPPVFNGDQTAAINALISASGGSGGGGVVNVTSSPHQLTAGESGSLVLLNTSSGANVLLPEITAETIGMSFDFFVLTAPTFGQYAIRGYDLDLLIQMRGRVMHYDEDTDMALNTYWGDGGENGLRLASATGAGARGGTVHMTAIAVGTWLVSATLFGGGEPASPFFIFT